MKYQDKKVLVVGMAKSGLSAAKLLQKLGAQVALYDRKPKEQFQTEIIPALLEAGAVDFLGAEEAAAEDWAEVLVLSPGVPIKQPFIEAAVAAGKPVISEIELGYQTAQAQFVGIGGTNGKTTTTALTGEIFKNAKRKTYVLGNIGLPICEHSLESKAGETIVAEIAALQLETIDTFRPRAFALLNVTEDHQDRFGNMEYYTHCKMRAFENQQAEDYAVLNADDPITSAQADRIHSHLLWFSRKREVEEGAFVREGSIIFRLDGQERVVCKTSDIRIPGNHNLENALAATCLAMCMGIDAETVAYTLNTFPGVEHRIEFVKEVNGISFINDSKGTNPDSTIKAIETMTKPTILILGGYDKHSEFDEMFAHFTEHIAGIVILGATKQKILAAANRAGVENIMLAETFEEAVKTAYTAAPKGGVVLLSPACASWDMFANFEQRGDIFKEIVYSL